ncbi:hypothetical protein AgCh_033067 [Apium graveolens]
MDGKVHTYKTRLVTKGFKQIHGIDYDETFSPVVMVKSIRILLATTAYYDYEIWQMDVKTAFLNGSLEEDVYMIQPEGFVDPKFDKMVFKKFGFIQNEDEPCVYKKAFKTWLGNSFSMKDLGDATYILGIKICRDGSRKLIGLSQSTYIDKVLHHFGMQEAKRGYVPMAHGILISKDNCPKSLDDKGRMRNVPYASEIGFIMYAIICTRPDVLYALIMMSKYRFNTGEGHWTAVKNILNFQTDRDDYVSQSGFVFCLNGGAVSWKSSKQEIVADSKMEAEYIAASEASKEAVWIRKFRTGLGVVPSITDPDDLYCDNNGAIVQAKEPRAKSESKQIQDLGRMNTQKINSIKIPTFDKANYPLWKKKMLLFIRMANPLYIQILKNRPFTPMVRDEESTDGDMVIPAHYSPKDPSEYSEPEKEKVSLDCGL